MTRKNGKLSVNVTYPFTGTFIDEMIEKTLDTKSRSSGCSFGEWGSKGQSERDMQFTLPDTPQSRKRIDLLKRQQGVNVSVE